MKKWMPLFIAVLFWIAFNLGFRTLFFITAPVHPAVWNRYIVVGVFGVLTAFAVTRIFLKYEGKTRAHIGLTLEASSLPKFLIGLTAGMLLCAVLFLTVVGLTSYEFKSIEAPDYFRAFGLSFMILFGLGFMEEIAYRSHPLLKLQTEYGVRTAIYVTSIAFAFYHGWGLGNLLGPGVWGLYYGLMAVWSKGIALPFGFHVGLNQVQTLIGLKPHYAEGLWALEEGSGSSTLAVNQVGTGIQIVLLLIGVALIEWYLRRRHQPAEPALKDS